MKSRSLSLIVTLILLMSISGVFVITQLDTTRPPQRGNDPIPYIYYYSDLEHAFVIERADGTDSRLLAQGVMPEEQNVIDSVHWSPSGEYFAWRSHRYNGPISAWLASSDGTYVGNFWDEAIHVYLMEWSPVQDLLVVGYATEFPDIGETIRLIDVPDNRIVAEIKFNSLNYIDEFYSRDISAVWSDDGAFFYFEYSHPDGTSITKVDLNGTIEQWYFDDNANFSNGLVMRSENPYQNSWVFTDLTMNESITYLSFPSNAVPDIDFNVVLNPQNTMAIVYETICEVPDDRQTCQTTKALFDREQGIRHELPDNLWIPNSHSGPYFHYYYTEEVWSPDGNLVFLTDINRNLYLLDTSTRAIQDMGGDISLWYWIDDHDLLLDRRDETYPQRYTTADNITSEMIFTYDNDNMPGWLVVSPDSSFVAYINGLDIAVQNIESGELYTYPTPGLGVGVGSRRDYKWHDSNEWFFSGTNTNPTGYNSAAIMIHNLNDSFGRELTYCHSVRTCAGFVPDNALTFLRNGQDASIIPAPIITVIHEGSVNELVWNPDGTQFASYSRNLVNNQTGGQVTIVDVSGVEPIVIQMWDTELICSQLCGMDWNTENNTVSMTGTRNGGFTRTRATFHINTNAVNYEENVENPQFRSPDYQYRIEEDQDTGNFYLRDALSQTRLSENPLQAFSRNFYYSDYDEASDLLVSANMFDRGTLWDVSTGELLTEMNWGGSMIQFSPDGTRLAVASGCYVSIWDMTPYIEQVNNH